MSYVVTVPGALGLIGALAGEWIVAFIMMMVLFTSNDNRLNRYTGVFAGCLVMLYVTFKAPLLGFGVNPARSFASAFPAQNWTAFWLYVLVPPLSMVLASALYQSWFGRRAIKCAKLHHANHKRCIFRCSYQQQPIDLSDRLLNS